MEFEILQLLLLTITGIIAGWLNVMAGGGSLFTIPVMLFMGIPAPVANGTNRIGILLNITAIYGFFRKGLHNFKLSFSLASCATLGAIVGASLGVQIQGKFFNYLLVTVMLLVILVTITGQKNTNENQTGTPKNLLLGHLFMIVAGFWGGLIQVGVGFILMPILNRVMGLNLVHTNMHKVTIVSCYTIVALAIFASQVQILWVVGLVLAIGNGIGSYLGAHTTVVKGEKWIKTVLYITLTAFIIKLLLS